MHHKKWLHLPDTLKGRQINCCSTQWCIFLLFLRENLGFLECLRVAKILNFYCSAAHVHVGLSVFQLSLICTSIILSRDQYEETDHTCFIYANTCKYMGLEINLFLYWTKCCDIPTLHTGDTRWPRHSFFWISWSIEVKWRVKFFILYITKQFALYPRFQFLLSNLNSGPVIICSYSWYLEVLVTCTSPIKEFVNYQFQKRVKFNEKLRHVFTWNVCTM